MEKVKLTQEQANALKAALKKESADAILKSAAREYETWFNECQPLNYMDLLTIAKALYAGYEVEETFEPGDKVITKKGNELVTLSNPLLNKPAWFLEDDHEKCKWIYTQDFRLATPEEIYWLETLGRRYVGEFKLGDVFVDGSGDIYKVNGKAGINGAVNFYKKGDFQGLYPAGSLKPYPEEALE